MSVKYTVKLTNKFRKGYKAMENRNLDIALLDEIIVMLAQGSLFPPKTATMR